MSDDDAGLRASDSAAGGAAFDGPVEFGQALFDALRHASEKRTRRLCWCDADFAQWPLGNVEWVSMLTRWAKLGGRELVMVASDYAVIERLHPRFVEWRRDWAHVIRCRVPEEGRPGRLPTLWLDSDDQTVRVVDPDRWRGRIGFDRVDRQRAREEVDAILQRAGPGFSSTTLGL